MLYKTFIEIEGLSQTLQEFLPQIGEHYQGYTANKNAAMIHRMKLIGKCSDYQSQFSQRSDDHRLLRDAMAAEGWGEETIKQNRLAWKAYKHLEEWGIPEAQAMLELCSVAHLSELGAALGKGGTLNYDASVYCKRHKKMHSVKALRGYKAGHFNNKFEPRSKPKQIEAAKPAPPQPQPQKREPVVFCRVPTPPHPVSPYEAPRALASQPVELPTINVTPISPQQRTIPMVIEQITQSLQELDTEHLSQYKQEVQEILAPVRLKLEILNDSVNGNKLWMGR